MKGLENSSINRESENPPPSGSTSSENADNVQQPETPEQGVPTNPAGAAAEFSGNSGNVVSDRNDSTEESEKCANEIVVGEADIQDHQEEHEPTNNFAADSSVEEPLEPELGYFRVSESSERSYFRGALRLTSRQIFRLEGPAEASVTDFMSSLENVVSQILSETLGVGAAPDDFIRVILYSKAGASHPVSTRFFRVSDFNSSIIMTTVLQSSQSGLSWRIGNGVEIEIKLIRLPNANERNTGGSKKYSSVNLETTAKQRRSIVEITNDDDAMCMARAIVVCLARKKYDQSLKTSKDYQTYKKFRESEKPHQTAKAKALCDRIKTSTDIPCGDEELKKMEVAENCYVKIIGGDVFNSIVYDGVKENFRVGVPVSHENVIFLFRRKIFAFGSSTEKLFHFDAVVDVKAFFDGKKNFCNFCNRSYNDIHSHKCPDVESWCYSCWDRTCTKVTGRLSSDEEITERCDTCHVIFADQLCKTRHQEGAICKEFVFCVACRKKFKRQNVISKEGLIVPITNFEALSNHTCTRVCPVCRSEIDSVFHKCYLQPTDFKTPNENILFMDFEAEQNSGVHVAIFCHMIWYDKKKNSWEEKSFGVSPNVLEDVGRFLFSKQFQGFTFVAHNMKAYDGCFLLQYMGENNIKPTPIFSGHKITSLYVVSRKIRIIDSLNFLTMPLSAFSKAFGLPESKGYFPHFFSKPENFDYVGPMPNTEYYGAGYMKPEERKRFLVWYEAQKEQNVVFNFRESIAEYCRKDVVVLRDGCVAFKNLLMELTGGQCDPFTYTTLAGVSSAVYRGLFMKKDTIAAVPPNGYSSSQAYSSKSLEWLEYLRECEGKSGILHIGNSPTGEGQIANFRVDGYDEKSKTVYEFNGCHFHGCQKCYHSNRYELHPVLKQTYETLYKKTQEKKYFLKKQGYKVETMWECDWNKKKKESSKISQFVKDNQFHLKPMNPFDSFMGGRVETFRMFVENEGFMNYVDFTSLYPFINCKKEYPVGHPEIILNNFGDLANICDRYFGFMKCEIVPPKNLHLPVLPGKFGEFKKLLFVLCRTCGEQTQSSECTHSESERKLLGTWFIPEIKKAVEKGYVIKKVHGIYHFEQKSSQLFSDFMQLFYKLKLISSGIPEGCDTEAKLQSYIDQVQNQEQITLNRNEFEINPGKRQLSKLLLNSLWGRFGLKRNKPQSTFCGSISDAAPFFEDAKIEVSDLTPFHENLALLTYKVAAPEFLDINNDANVYIASATTAYARLELYSQMDKVGQRLVYCDTDSIIYISEEGSNLETGNFLGELTNELLPGDHISHFVSGGPKNYAYKTLLGNIVLKSKGFSLNFTNAEKFNFESMREMVLNFISPDDDLEGDLNDCFVNLPSSTVRSRKNISHRDKANSESHALAAEKPSALATSNFISFYNPDKICRSKTFTLLRRPEQKLYTINYDKRAVFQKTGKTQPFGF